MKAKHRLQKCPELFWEKTWALFAFLFFLKEFEKGRRCRGRRSGRVGAAKRGASVSAALLPAWVWKVCDRPGELAKGWRPTGGLGCLSSPGLLVATAHTRLSRTGRPWNPKSARLWPRDKWSGGSGWDLWWPNARRVVYKRLDLTVLASDSPSL